MEHVEAQMYVYDGYLVLVVLVALCLVGWALCKKRSPIEVVSLTMLACLATNYGLPEDLVLVYGKKELIQLSWSNPYVMVGTQMEVVNTRVSCEGLTHIVRVSYRVRRPKDSSEVPAFLSVTSRRTCMEIGYRLVTTQTGPPLLKGWGASNLTMEFFNPNGEDAK